MKHTLRVARVFTLAVSSLIVLAGVAQALPEFQYYDIHVDPATLEGAASTDADLIVYATQPLLGGDTDIRVYDAMWGLNNPLIKAGDQSEPDVWRHRIVYQDNRNGNPDIYLYDYDTAEEFQITSNGSVQVLPRICGDTIVWFDGLAGELWYHSIASDTTAKVPDSMGVSAYDVDNGRIVWAAGAPTSTLYSWRPDLLDSPRELLTLGAGKMADYLRAHADVAVYSWDTGGTPATEWIDLRSGIPTVEFASTVRGRPAVFHDCVVWDNNDSGSWDVFWDERGDGTVGLPLAHLAAAENFPAIFGNRVVWSDSDGWGDIKCATTTPTVDRVSGDDRYATAIAASNAYFTPATNHPDTRAGAAVLCTGEDFPDALAATPWAKFLSGPLLLTRKDSVPEGLVTEIKRLRVQTVYLVGGTAAISDGVKAQLEAELPGVWIERPFAGADRYDTARKIAAYLLDGMSSAGIEWDNDVFLARGDLFPDALAAAPVAAAAGTPILLTKPAALPAATVDALQDFEYRQGQVMGGLAAVSDSAKNQLDAVLTDNGGEPSKRWAGDDRYDTAAGVAEAGLRYTDMDLDMLGVATGTNFPDALAGGAICGIYGSPLVLVKPGEVPEPVELLLLFNHAAIGRAEVFGGTSAVSDATKDAFNHMLE